MPSRQCCCTIHACTAASCQPVPSARRDVLSSSGILVCGDTVAGAFSTIRSIKEFLTISPLNHPMAHALASHGVGALKNGLTFIERKDVTLNPAVKAKPGGFAIVHQGIFNGEVVAVKIPKDAGSLTEKQFKEFVRELTVMASVKHPHCVTLFVFSIPLVRTL